MTATVAARRAADRWGERILLTASLAATALNVALFAALFVKAAPLAAGQSPWRHLLGARWLPTQGEFGLGGFIAGTLWVTAVGAALAVPVSILAALYLAEYASPGVRRVCRPVVDLLAGISPVVYGFWGVLTVVPLVRDTIEPWCRAHLPIALFTHSSSTGYSVLAGGLVLAVMVTPLIIALAEESLSAVPRGEREASLTLGATQWQTVKFVVLHKALPGLTAAVLLGLSRAVGETMAVLMVAGCAVNHAPRSLFDTAYPLPALIANTYGEMMSIPLYDSAVFLAASALFTVTLIFHSGAYLLRARTRGAS